MRRRNRAARSRSPKARICRSTEGNGRRKVRVIVSDTIDKAQTLSIVSDRSTRASYPYTDDGRGACGSAQSPCVFAQPSTASSSDVLDGGTGATDCATNCASGRSAASAKTSHGVIAAHGGEDARKLFRYVLIAPASVPGISPPVSHPCRDSRPACLRSLTSRSQPPTSCIRRRLQPYWVRPSRSSARGSGSWTEYRILVPPRQPRVLNRFRRTRFPQSDSLCSCWPSS
jgi:hypothetical protein